MPDQAISATWYPTERFLRKADDEIYRSVRYQVPFALVSCSLESTEGVDAFRAFVSENLRQVDFVACIGHSHFVIGLPFTSAFVASVITRDLQAALSSYAPIVGAAHAPFEGRRAGLLLSTAELNARRQQLEADSPQLLRAS